MNLNIGKELATLQRLTVKELRTKYAEVFGESTNANNRGSARAPTPTIGIG